MLLLHLGRWVCSKKKSVSIEPDKQRYIEIYMVFSVPSNSVGFVIYAPPPLFPSAPPRRLLVNRRRPRAARARTAAAAAAATATLRRRQQRRHRRLLPHPRDRAPRRRQRVRRRCSIAAAAAAAAAGRSRGVQQRRAQLRPRLRVVDGGHEQRQLPRPLRVPAHGAPHVAGRPLRGTHLRAQLGQRLCHRRPLRQPLRLRRLPLHLRQRLVEAHAHARRLLQLELQPLHLALQPHRVAPRLFRRTVPRRYRLPQLLPQTLRPPPLLRQTLLRRRKRRTQTRHVLHLRERQRRRPSLRHRRTRRRLWRRRRLLRRRQRGG
eukprot:Rhum_TRINITY_DN14340_c19_g1::Rhum_TRINITY_DN14340_c19_g1_i1::g.83654::m.83654